MSACVWYISKYVSIPEARKGGMRPFMLTREMARRGVRSVVITSDSNILTTVPEFEGHSHRRVIDGVEIYWLKVLKYQRPNSLLRILSWLHFEWRLFRLPKKDLPKPDAVIVSSLSLLTIVNGIWLKWRHGCRLIFEVRDIWPLTIIEEGGFSARNPLVMGLRAVELLAYKRADAVVGTMPNLKQHVDESLRRHAAVHCIPFGYHDDMIKGTEPVPQSWIDQHLPQGKFIVCHAGTIGVTNALDTVLECARAMRDNLDVHFLMVGDGALRSQYEAMCADLPNVTFTGPVPSTMVLSVLGYCDLLYFAVHVSKVWKYGLSLNKVIDYMLSGKPILASYTGYPTMVEEAGGGTSVPAGDAAALQAEILRLQALPSDVLAAVGERGRDWLIKHRSYERLAQRYVNLALRGNPDAMEAA